MKLMKLMKTLVIINPHAGSAEDAHALRSALADRPDMVTKETTYAGQAKEFAQQATGTDYHTVVAAGGDGTINEVINGLACAPAQLRLGILPLGTGNDLARTLGVPLDPLDALRLLETGEERRLDIMRLETAGRVVYGLNVAAGGFTGQMNEELTDELKADWGPLAYILGAVKILPNLTDYETIITWEDGQPERIAALNVIVANGRTAAGGFQVAPTANPEDGLLDVVIIRSCSLVELASVSAQLLTGSYLDSPHIVHRRVRSVSISSQPGMWFNVDGELLTKKTLAFSVQPRFLRVVVGTDYAPIPEVPHTSNLV